MSFFVIFADVRRDAFGGITIHFGDRRSVALEIGMRRGLLLVSRAPFHLRLRWSIVIEYFWRLRLACVHARANCTNNTN
jgi:hypothetical protein